MILVYIVLILVLLVDLVLYIPLKLHIYQDNQCVYIYFYSLQIIKIDKQSHFNILKNKISIDNIIDSDKEDLKVINSINIELIYIRLNENTTLEHAQFLYPLLIINDVINIVDYKISYKTKFYIRISFKLSNLIFKLITIRRNKIERTSNK